MDRSPQWIACFAAWFSPAVHEHVLSVAGAITSHQTLSFRLGSVVIKSECVLDQKMQCQCVRIHHRTVNMQFHAVPLKVGCTGGRPADLFPQEECSNRQALTLR